MEKITAYKTNKGEIFENSIDAEQQELNYESFDFRLTKIINDNFLLESNVKGYIQFVLTAKSEEFIDILKSKK